MLLDEDMRVELRHPQPALRGLLQIGERRADIGLDALPEEAGILLGEVGRVLAAHLRGQADLVELELQGGELAQVGGIGELADQVGGADQAGLAVGLGMVAVLRHGEPGELDRPADALDVEMRAWRRSGGGRRSCRARHARGRGRRRWSRAVPATVSPAASIT